MMRRIVLTTSIIFVMIVIITIFSSNVSALTCYVPSVYPDVETAISNGCTTIIFDGNVVENNPITVNTPIQIIGSGYKWNLVNPAVTKVTFNVNGLVRMSNIIVNVNDSYTTVFLLRNTRLYLSNVRVNLFTQYGNVFRYDTPSTRDLYLYVDGLTVKEYLNLATIRFILNLPMSSGFSVDIYLNNYNVFGYTSSTSQYMTTALYTYTDAGGTVRISDATLVNSSIFIRAMPFSTEFLNVTLDGVTIRARGVPWSITSWYRGIIHFFVDGLLNLKISDLYVEGYSYNYGFMFTLAGNPQGKSYIYAKNIYIRNEVGPAFSVSYGGYFSIYIRLEDAYLLGTIGVNMDSWRAAPLSNSTVVIENFHIESRSWLNMGIVIEDMILNITFRNGSLVGGINWFQDFFRGVSIFYITMKDVTVRTSSFLSGIIFYSFTVNTVMLVDLDNIYVYPTFNPFLFYTGIFVFQLVSPSTMSISVSNSIIGRFYVFARSDFQMSLYETVYDGDWSFTSKDVNVTWTLEVYVESLQTGAPLSHVAVSFYEDFMLLETKKTNKYGIARYKFNYTIPAFTFGYNYMHRIRFSINESYFEGAWYYDVSQPFVTYKQPGLVPPNFLAGKYSLPSWFGRITLVIDPKLNIYGIGYMEHLPITISFVGDRGVINIYKDPIEVVYLYYNISYAKPVKVIHLWIVDVEDYGVYMFIRTRVFYDGMWLNQTFVYYDKQGILYSAGPLEVVALVRKV